MSDQGVLYNSYTFRTMLILVFGPVYFFRDTKSAGINVQLPQSATTPRRLTLSSMH